MKFILFISLIGFSSPLWAQSRTELILSAFSDKMEKEAPPSTSQGQSKVEAMLAANRAKLAKMREENAPKSKREEYEERAQKKRANYKERTNDLRNKWEEKRQLFLKNKTLYSSQTFKLEDFLGSQAGQQMKANSPLPTEASPLKEHILVGDALELKIKDQGSRATCASFAAIRAIEILSNGKEYSEEFFHFASKPTCRNSPCSRRGSWVADGFDYLKSHPLPLASDCPYSSNIKTGNETALPLKKSCFEGTPLNPKLRTLSSVQQILPEIEKKHPVIIGLRLTPNFYSTEAFIYDEGKFVGSSMDQHAQGHAVVIVGAMPLPQSQRKNEGDHCYIIANSWGEGWGTGGHACASEKWLENQRIERALVSVEKI